MKVIPEVKSVRLGDGLGAWRSGEGILDVWVQVMGCHDAELQIVHSVSSG